MLPVFCLGALTILAYGWAMHFDAGVAAPAVLLFVLGYCLIGAYQVLNVLMVDVHPGKAATATAANNFVRCELGAAASAAVAPLVDRVGSGWTYSLAAFVCLAFAPAPWAVMRCGPRWRREREEKRERRAREREAREAREKEGA